MRGSPAPVALATAVLALAACGGNDTAAPLDTEAQAEDAVAQYEQEIRAADEIVRSASERVAGGTIEPASLATELEQARRHVDGATPPYDALPAHQRLSQALGEATDAAAGLGGGGSPEPAELEQLDRTLSEAEAAIAELAEQGYDVRAQT